MYSNQLDGAYSQATTDVNKKNEFTFLIETGFDIDSIYVGVIAVDGRFNKSPMSAVLHLSRPDVTAPSTPLITQLLGTKDGIRVAWALPADNDLKFVKLQRKRSDGYNWKDIHICDPKDSTLLDSIPEELVRSNYLDDDTLELMSYDYRILCADQSGNHSVSKIKKIRPYDDGIRGDIRPFTLVTESQYLRYVDLEGNAIQVSDNPNATLAQILNSGLNPGNIGNNIISGSSAGGNGQTVSGLALAAPRLTWDYVTEFPKSLINFKIYRKSPMFHTNDASQITDKYVLVKTITPDRASRNADFFNVHGYLWFDRTAVPLPNGMKYTYRIVAEHSDGGFSKWSTELEIDL